MRFPLWLGGALAALFVLNAAAALALLQPPQFAAVLDPSQIYPNAGAAWTAPVRLGNAVFKVAGDDAGRSSLRLFEGRTELAPAHALHEEIRQKGGGRFSHWGEWLYFSTSDGSDPRHNGRTYSLMAVGALDARLLLALALFDLVTLAGLRVVLVRRYGRSFDHVTPGPVLPALPPLALAALVTVAAFVIAWLCGLTYRTNDDPSMRAIAEGAFGGRASEFLIYLSILPGLALRVLHGIAPQVPWYDLLIAAGIGTGAFLLLAALLRLCRDGAQTIFVALLGLIVFAGVFQNLQFSAAAILLGGGAAALTASMALRPPVAPARLRLGGAAAALAFFWGSLIRFEATFLAAALVAPILLLATRQRLAALRVPLAGVALGIVLALGGRAFDEAWFRFTPGWETVLAEKRARLRVSEYLHADLTRAREFDAALAAVEWSRNDYDLITNWMFALPGTFGTERMSRFAALAPTSSWTERIADFYRVLAPATHVLWLFAAVCVLVLAMARSFFALAAVFAAAGWLAVLLTALSIVFKPEVLHILWVLCGAASLVGAATGLAGTLPRVRAGYRVIEDRVIAAGALAALGCVALWQIADMDQKGRADDALRAQLARDLASWPSAPGTTLIAWDADFPFETWVRPFHALPAQRPQIYHTTHVGVMPLADPFYAAWGTRDLLWALCHDRQMYLIDARRGYTERHARMLSTYMRERHGEEVSLAPLREGEAVSLLACRPAEKGG